MAARRLTKELKDINNDPPQYCVAGPVDPNDMFVWTAEVTGPPDTPYNKGKFILDIIFPKNYPFKPPKVTFRTKIFHPNIEFKINGRICCECCMDILGEDNWSP
eukprot:301120_1